MVWTYRLSSKGVVGSIPGLSRSSEFTEFKDVIKFVVYHDIFGDGTCTHWQSNLIMRVECLIRTGPTLELPTTQVLLLW